MNKTFNRKSPSMPDDTRNRLAEIKRLAAVSGPSSDSDDCDLDERDLYRDAASTLAGLRMARGDLVGTLIWEGIAREATSLRSPNPVACVPDLDDEEGVPVHGATPDRHNAE